MAVEWDNRSEKQEVVVEHFHSPVVELISFIASLLDSDNKNNHDTNYAIIEKELEKSSTDFLHYWNSRTDWSFTFIFNFLLPTPRFYDADLFVQEISALSEIDFLYHFFGESIPAKQLEELLKNPEYLTALEPAIWWETDAQKTIFKELIVTLPCFRENLSKLLLNVYRSNIFQDELTNRSMLSQQSIEKVKSMELEPLALAQYIMGKTFRRTSFYQMYYFVPSYFFSTHRIRIFDSRTCVVIYGVNAPLEDHRERSAELEQQLKALSDRNRILILRMLAGKKEYGAKIAEYLGITTATVSHHLEILKKAGFVNEEKVGTIKYFSYNQEHAKDTLTQLNDFINCKKV